MNPAQALGLFSLRVLAAGGFTGYILTLIHLQHSPRLIQQHPYAFCLVVSFLFAIIDKVVIYPRYRDPLRSVPVVRRNKEGNKLLYESPRGKSALEWIEQHPDAQLIRLWGGASTAAPILVSGPEALRDVLNTNVYDFEKPWGVRAFLSRAIGWGVILAEGNEHKRQRKSLTGAFHVRRIRELYGLMWEKTQIFLQQLEKDVDKHMEAEGEFGVVEFSEWTSRLTLDVIGPTAMGHDFNSLTAKDNPIADAFLELLRPEFRRLVFFGLHFMIPEYIIRLLPLKENHLLNDIGGYLRRICDDIIAEKKTLKKSAHVAEHDILSDIIQTGYFTDKGLSEQMMTFLSAGHETTASALTWACYLCAKYPEVQRTLRSEIHHKIPSHASEITHDLMESMPYLNGVCEETLRLYPTVPVTVREAIRDTTVAGYTVPKGTDFLLVPYAINRNPILWPNPHMIVPERWIDQHEDGTRRANKTGGMATNFSELTFLHGPRACIGRDFAKAELRCAVAGVIGKFEVELNTQEEPRVQGVITMKAEGGMYLRFKPIRNW